MSSIIYLLRKSLKNTIREIMKKPAKLILYGFVVVMLVFVIVVGMFTETEQSDLPNFMFPLLVFAFITMLLIVSISKALSRGDTLFEMNDVNLLFVSPLNPQKILLYGIIRLTKVSFWACFFILFQSSTFSSFGVGTGGLVLTFFGCIISMVVFSVLSLVIYNFSNGNPRRKLAVKLITLAVFLPVIIFAGLQYLDSANWMIVGSAVAKSPFMNFIPVAGWTAAGIYQILFGELLTGLIYLFANILLIAGLVVYILKSKMDYYEDVLVATETAYEKKRQAEDGDIMAAQATAKKVATGKTGILGNGASAIFGKHFRESFRENKLGFLSLSSLIIVAGAIAVCYFIKDFIALMNILAWVQIMMIGTGRGLKETHMHYIYMIPQSSFKKILWSNMELFSKTLIENVLIFVIGGILIAANPLYTILSLIVYTLFSFLLVSINYLSMRFTGADISAGILIFIYFIAVIVIMLPGLIGGIIIGTAIGGFAGTMIGLLIISAWELLAGMICFFFARGVLHDTDMATINFKS